MNAALLGLRPPMRRFGGSRDNQGLDPFDRSDRCCRRRMRSSAARSGSIATSPKKPLACRSRVASCRARRHDRSRTRCRPVSDPTVRRTATLFCSRASCWSASRETRSRRLRARFGSGRSSRARRACGHPRYRARRGSVRRRRPNRAPCGKRCDVPFHRKPPPSIRRHLASRPMTFTHAFSGSMSSGEVFKGSPAAAEVSIAPYDAVVRCNRRDRQVRRLTRNRHSRRVQPGPRTSHLSSRKP